MPRAFSGVRALLYFGDTLAGWCTGISGTINDAQTRIDVLGNIETEEIEPVGRTVTFTADFVHILGNSLKAMGLFPKGGTIEAINFAPLTAIVYDKVGDEAIFRIEGARPESQSFRVDRTGVMTVNTSFQALRMVDPSVED